MMIKISLTSKNALIRRLNLIGLQYIGITYASEYKPKLTFAKLMLIMLVIV